MRSAASPTCSVDGSFCAHGPSCSGSGFVARSWVRAALLCAAVGFSLSLSSFTTAFADDDLLPEVAVSTSMPVEPLLETPTLPILSESPTGTVLQADPSQFESITPAPALLDAEPAAPTVDGPVLPLWWDHPEVVEYRFVIVVGLGLIVMLLGVRVVGSFGR